MSLPAKLEMSVNESIDILTKQLSVHRQDAKTHVVLHVTGWDQSDGTKNAVAWYLVGLIASAVDMTLSIRTDLIADSTDDRLEVVVNVEDIALSDPETERNPWIAEAMWHLCLLLAGLGRLDIHPPGRIVALHPPHMLAKDHGLDVTAIYEVKNALGLCIVETKAYSDDPNGAISSVMDSFRKLSNTHSRESRKIRAAANLMRTGLPAHAQAMVSPSFWKHTRCFVPNPHCDALAPVNWDYTRSSFRDLQVDREQIIVMPHSVHGFNEFFDSITNQMLSIARSL